MTVPDAGPPTTSAPHRSAASRPFEPGTTGWTAADLDEPTIRAWWEAGVFEIIEGVLTRMPPRPAADRAPLETLLATLREHLSVQHTGAAVWPDMDYVLNQQRVVHCDAVVLTPEDAARQQSAAQTAGRVSRGKGARGQAEKAGGGAAASGARTRLLVPPTLIVASVSPGCQQHERVTKRRFYAEAGVGFFWILDSREKTLECLELTNGIYHAVAEGWQDAVVCAKPFEALKLNLRQIWG